MRGLALTVDGRVRYIADFRIAKDGVVRTASGATVACEGIARQWWPSTLDPNSAGILLSSGEAFARDIRRVNGPVVVDPPPEDPPNTEPDPSPQPIPPQQEPSATWFEAFGNWLRATTTHRFQEPIPSEGIGITFTVRSTDPPAAILVRTIQVAGQTSTPNRRVSLSTSPLDFNGLAFQSQAVGQSMLIRMNGSTQTASGEVVYVDIGQGRYYLNLKNESIITTFNWLRVECFYVEQ